MENIESLESELWLAFNNSEEFNHFLFVDNNLGEERITKLILLTEEIITIGRNEDNNIILASGSISRHHAHLVKHQRGQEYSYEIIDGDIHGNISKHGITVNKQKVNQRSLQHGDVVTLAKGINLIYFIDQTGELGLIKRECEFNEVNNNNYQENEQKEIVGESDNIAKNFNQKSFVFSNQYSLDDLLKFASIVNLLPTPIIELNEQGLITFLNPIAKAYFPHLDHRNFNHPLLKDLLPFPQKNTFNFYKRQIKIENHYYEQYVHYLYDFKLLRLYIFDISTLKKQKNLLKQKVYYDFFLDLPNYKFFLDDLQKSLKAHQRNERQLAVMIIELENSQLISPENSDKLEKIILKDFAQRIKKCFREEDTVAYWQNNQFIISLSELSDFKDIGVIGNRLLKYIKKPFFISNDSGKKQQLFININIGVSVYPYDAKDKENLIRKAFYALTNSKYHGSNNYTLYSPRFNFESKQYNRILNNLQSALEKQEFTIYYQPIVNCQLKEIVALEALIRWNNPQLGIVYPQDFLDLAEKNDLITELTLWMLEQIFNHKKATNLSQFQKIPIAVNLSAKLFSHPLIWQKITNLIKTNQQYFHSLILEVTQQVFVNKVVVKDALKELLSLGIKIALDDFGTYNSSLEIIKQFPFHFLKIGQEFTKKIKDNPQDKAIIQGISIIAKGFNMKIIAEGVETQEQWDILQNLGCNCGQGYLFSPALPLAEIDNLLANNMNF